LALRLLAGM